MERLIQEMDIRNTTDVAIVKLLLSFGADFVNSKAKSLATSLNLQIVLDLMKEFELVEYNKYVRETMWSSCSVS